MSFIPVELDSSGDNSLLNPSSDEALQFYSGEEYRQSYHSALDRASFSTKVCCYVADVDRCSCM